VEQLILVSALVGIVALVTREMRGLGRRGTA
jgi:hypothetical protein